MENIFHANSNEKIIGISILITDKRDFNVKTFIKGKEEYYIFNKWSLHQEVITTLSIHSPNNKSPPQKKSMNH